MDWAELKDGAGMYHLQKCLIFIQEVAWYLYSYPLLYVITPLLERQQYDWMVPAGDEEQLIEADSEQSRTEMLMDRQKYFEECEVSWQHPVAEGTEVQPTPE